MSHMINDTDIENEKLEKLFKAFDELVKEANSIHSATTAVLVGMLEMWHKCVEREHIKELLQEMINVLDNLAKIDDEKSLGIPLGENEGTGGYKN